MFPSLEFILTGARRQPRLMHSHPLAARQLARALSDVHPEDTEMVNFLYKKVDFDVLFNNVSIAFQVPTINPSLYRLVSSLLESLSKDQKWPIDIEINDLKLLRWLLKTFSDSETCKLISTFF